MMTGIGVEDKNKAFTCYQKSAEVGFANGIFAIGDWNWN